MSKIWYELMILVATGRSKLTFPRQMFSPYLHYVSSDPFEYFGWGNMTSPLLYVSCAKLLKFVTVRTSESLYYDKKCKGISSRISIYRNNTVFSLRLLSVRTNFDVRIRIFWVVMPSSFIDSNNVSKELLSPTLGVKLWYDFENNSRTFTTNQA